MLEQTVYVSIRLESLILYYQLSLTDLPMNIKSKVRLFADDAALYLTISTSSQSEILQKDLDNLERWSHKWDMEFNPSKCQVIHITRSKIPIPTQYTLHNCILESVSVYANVRRIAEIRKWSDMIEKKSVFVCHNVRWNFSAKNTNYRTLGNG